MLNDISYSRIARWALACLIVFTSFAFIFNVGIASAETGKITVLSSIDVNGYIHIGQEFAGFTTNYSMFVFDYTDFRTLSRLRAVGQSLFFAPIGGNFTTFTIKEDTGNSGYGFVYWSSVDGLNGNVTWTFSESTNIVTSPVYLTYAENIFSGWSTVCNKWDGALDTAHPMFLATTTGEQCSNIATATYWYALFIGSYTNVSYNVTYPTAGAYKLAVTKYPSNIATKLFIHSASKYQLNESSFNNNYLDFFADFLDGLYVNVTTSAGGYSDVLINATNTTKYINQIVVDPITGVGIRFDASSYSIGGTANISWIRTDPTPFGFVDKITITSPSDLVIGGFIINTELVGSPPDIGYIKTTLTASGTYTIDFKRSLLGSSFFLETLASDTAVVSAAQPTWILVNSSYRAGLAGNIAYFQDATATDSFQFYYWSEATQEYRFSYGTWGAASGVVSNWSFNCGIITKYKIVLGQAVAYTNCISDNTAAQYAVNYSALNVSSTTPNINEYLRVNYTVSNFSWINNQTHIRVYDKNNIQIYDYPVTKQISEIPFFLVHAPDTFLDMVVGSGANTIKLENDKGFILATQTITVSDVSAGGYGLIMDKKIYCGNEKISYKYYSPDIVNITLWNDQGVLVSKGLLNTSISGQTAFFLYSVPGKYDVRLTWSGIQYANDVIEIKGSCVPVPTPPPISGAGQAVQVALLITSSIFWALIITSGLMLAIAWKTRDGFPTGIIGMLSAGIFSFLGWLPFWIFFSVLIIGALFIAESIVSKQLSKLG